ncbi:MAG: rhodanese-like domain-containing protein [Vicinamibacteria bacterium]|jgi:rhodanese-related sulfurtransferase|nr:rhodanese-like domain-containing protein [Vicinamibacteria bacterium]
MNFRALLLIGVALAAPAFAAEPARMTAEELKPLVDSGQAVLLDVRSAPAFQSEHAEGARHIPLDEVGKRLGELPKDKLIAAYCT